MDKLLCTRLLLFQLLLLSPFVLLCFFVWPSSDDYAMSFMMHESGESSFSVIQVLYHHWGGRYSTLLGALLSPVVVNHLWFYRLLLAGTMLLLYLSVRWFWAAVLVEKGVLPHVVTAGFLLLWLQVIPGMADGFYWHSGVVVYTWPLILFFFVAGALLRPNKGIALKIAAGLAAFLLVGFNEVAALLALLLTILYALSSGKSPKETQRWWLVLAVIVGMVILLLSPGNAKRMDLFTEGGNLWQAVKISMISLIKLNGIQLQSMPLWLLVIVLLPQLKKEFFNERLHAIVRLHPWAIALAVQGLLLLLLFIPAWSMGINPPLRVYNFLSPLWLLGFWWLTASLRMRMDEQVVESWPAFRGAGLKVMLGVIALSFMVHFVKVPGGELVIGGNVPRAWHDLLFRATDYNRAMHEREGIIREARNNGVPKVIVPALQNPPGTIHFLDIQPDPGHWINGIVAGHYGVEELSVEE